jgi:hypothetical protein
MSVALNEAGLGEAMRRSVDPGHGKSQDRTNWTRFLHHSSIREVADLGHASPEDLACVRDNGALRVGGYLVSTPGIFDDWLNARVAAHDLSIGGRRHQQC